MQLGPRDCCCGARFVGEPLDDEPAKVQRLGPAMTAALLLISVAASALLFTKWLAFAGVIVIWSARRAMRLARREPDWYGGYRTAAATLVVTLLSGAIAAGYTVSYVPQFLENRQTRKVAATQAAMYHLYGMLEDYKRTYGSYPTNMQAIKKAINKSLPSDYWEQSIKYQSYTEAIADRSLASTGIAFTNFELRSAGSDGKEATDDDIIMRDGIFFTNSEAKKQPVAQSTPDR